MKKEKSSSQTTSKKKSGGTWLLVTAVVVFGGVAWFALRSTDSDTQGTSSDKAPVAADSRTPAGTLNPLLFTGKIRAAYQVAMDIPDILKQIACYCGCKEEEGHKSNYFCFADQHGVGCEECQNIALDTKTLHDAGYSVAQIQEAIRIKYAP